MFEILSRLPVKSLLIFKCVCKRWNEIIEHPKFIQMHMRQNTELSTYVRKDETFTILDTRYGLLLEKSNISTMYRIRNPATKQILVVPDPGEEPIFMTIVFLASTNSYKLVFVYESEGEVESTGFKVLSFESSDLSWRALGYSCLCKLDSIKPKISLQFQGKFLYFIELYENGSCDSQVHCLDVETEIFRGSSIILPRNLFRNWEKVALGIWDETFIAVMNIVEEDLHVWVLEDPIRGKWAEKKIIIPLTFLKENPDMKKRLVPYWASHEKIYFTKDDGDSITFYIMSKQAWETQYSVPPGKTYMWNEGCTLVKLKGMQPDMKLSD